MEQDRKNQESTSAAQPATPAAAPDDESTVVIVGDDGVVDEPSDADRPDFNDDRDPGDAP